MEVSKYKYWFLLPILAILITLTIYFSVTVNLRNAGGNLGDGGILGDGRDNGNHNDVLKIRYLSRYKMASSYQPDACADDMAGNPKLIIDHDGGADDAMAIFMALLYEQYFNGSKVVALTTTHGNVDEDQSFINSQRILHIAERSEVPIYRGSNFSLVIDVPSDYFFGEDGLGDNKYEDIKSNESQPEHAALGIIELTKKYPDEITLVTLGALTNVALAIRLDPSFVSRLAHLYIAAGHVYSEEFESPEYNAEQDVEAYHVAVQNANPDKVTIIPFSQVTTSTVTRNWRVNVLGAIPTKIMKAQNEFERISIDFENTWSLLDPIAMGAVLNSSIIGDIKYSKNSINLCGGNRGININNFTTVADSNVKVFNEIREEEYKDLLISIFSAELIR